MNKMTKSGQAAVKSLKFVELLDLQCQEEFSTALRTGITGYFKTFRLILSNKHAADALKYPFRKCWNYEELES